LFGRLLEKLYHKFSATLDIHLDSVFDPWMGISLHRLVEESQQLVPCIRTMTGQAEMALDEGPVWHFFHPARFQE
jgi:hypothetical protein